MENVLPSEKILIWTDATKTYKVEIIFDRPSKDSYPIIFSFTGPEFFNDVIEIKNHDAISFAIAEMIEHYGLTQTNLNDVNPTAKDGVFVTRRLAKHVR